MIYFRTTFNFLPPKYCYDIVLVSISILEVKKWHLLIPLPRKSIHLSSLMGIWESWLVGLIQAWSKIKTQSDMQFLGYKELAIIVCVKKQIMVVQVSNPNHLPRQRKEWSEVSLCVFTITFNKNIKIHLKTNMEPKRTSNIHLRILSQGTVIMIENLFPYRLSFPS